MRKLGADATLNYKSEPQWGARAAELAGGTIHHVVEVGGLGTLAQSMQAVGFGGEIALIGVLSMQGDGNPMPLMLKGASVRGIFVGSAAMAQELNAFVDRACAQARRRPRLRFRRRQGRLRLPGLGRAVRQGRHRQSGLRPRAKPLKRRTAARRCAASAAIRLCYIQNAV